MLYSNPKNLQIMTSKNGSPFTQTINGFSKTIFQIPTLTNVTRIKNLQVFNNQVQINKPEKLDEFKYEYNGLRIT